MDVEVQQALLRLAALDASERLSGAETLCSLLSELDLDASADAGVQLCAALRAGGAVELLCGLLRGTEQQQEEQEPQQQAVLRQRALFALGNMCSGETDTAAAETRGLLLRCGGVEPLLACAASTGEGTGGEGTGGEAGVQASDGVQTCLLACGAMQHLCREPAWCKALVQRDVVPLLEKLVRARGGGGGGGGSSNLTLSLTLILTLTLTRRPPPRPAPRLA